MVMTYNVIHVFKSLYFHSNNIIQDHYSWHVSHHAITHNIFHSSLCWTYMFFKQMYINFANLFHYTIIPLSYNFMNVIEVC
jgi:hypothetical protein